jgi:hypothetical protein
MRKFLRLGFLFGCCLVLGAVAFIAYYVSRPPVPEVKLRALQPGMSAGAVRELLGPPTTFLAYSNNAEMGLVGTNWAAEWIYSRDLPWSSTWVNVMLTNGSVSYVGRDRFP